MGRQRKKKKLAVGKEKKRKKRKECAAMMTWMAGGHAFFFSLVEALKAARSHQTPVASKGNRQPHVGPSKALLS